MPESRPLDADCRLSGRRPFAEYPKVQIVALAVQDRPQHGILNPAPARGCALVTDGVYRTWDFLKLFTFLYNNLHDGVLNIFNGPNRAINIVAHPYIITFTWTTMFVLLFSTHDS